MIRGSAGRGRRRLPRTRLLSFILVTILFIIAAATTVTITKANDASYAGSLIKAYYENANAPTGPIIFIDTSTGAWSNGGNTVGLSLTTSTANEVLYLSNIARAATVSSVASTPALTWTQRRLAAFTQGGNTINLEAWYAIWSSSGTITVTVTDSATNNGAAVLFGIAGANTATPFDTNAAVPASATDGGTAGTTATVSISTSNANDMIVGAVGVSGGTPALTNGGSSSAILTQAAGTFRETSDEYQVVSSAQSGLAVSYTWTGAQNWAMIADAVQKASGSGCTYPCLTVDTQTGAPTAGQTGSFSLSGGSSMYLWSPQFGTSTAIPAGSLSLQLFAHLPSPALDGSASGALTSSSTTASMTVAQTAPTSGAGSGWSEVAADFSATGTVTKVRQTTGATKTTSPFTCAFSSQPAVNDLIVVAFDVTPSTLTVSLVTDNQGNALSLVSSATEGASAVTVTSYMYAEKVTGATASPVTVTLTGGTLTDAVVTCTEWSGVSSTVVTSGTYQGTTSSSTINIALNTAITPTSGDLVYAFAGYSNCGGTATPNAPASPWTLGTGSIGGGSASPGPVACTGGGSNYRFNAGDVYVNSWSALKLGSALTTTSATDLIVVSLVTYKSGSSITATAVTDSLGAVAWQASARSSTVSCSGTQETTRIEWYGTTSATLTTDTIGVTLSSGPTASSMVVFGVSGADLTTPFDPQSALPKSNSDCSGASTAPTVSAVSTIASTDLMLGLFGGYTSVTETAGSIGGATGTLVAAFAGTGDSNSAEYKTVSAAQSSSSCAFGTSSSYWGVVCDAVMSARQTVQVSFVTTNTAGVVQSVMISSAGGTVTSLYSPVSIASNSGTIPASGYIRVLITAPTGVALTVFWGFGNPTQFQVSYTYRST